MGTNEEMRQGHDEGEMLRLASAQVRRALRALSETLDALEAHEPTAIDKAKLRAVDLRKAIQAVFEERHRLEKLCTDTPAPDESRMLDLDAARAEIGRRLARLRDAGGREGLSGGAE